VVRWRGEELMVSLQSIISKERVAALTRRLQGRQVALNKQGSRVDRYFFLFQNNKHGCVLS
jgi:hypothetical protein